tara:strand:- start:254 stop:1204 length:951 start_codon:yes stop_codon:yes gene_type:complete
MDPKNSLIINRIEYIETDDIIDLNYIVEPTDNNIIRHLVIAGGGTMGFTYYGIIREAHRNNIWHLSNIHTIYGTSVGSIIGTIISLNYDWNTIDEYFINRPWEKVFKYDINSVLSSLQTQGIFGKSVIKDIFKPLLLGKNMPIDITMLQFYEITHIEIHIIATNVNEFKMVDISYKTHPSWSIIDAITASCSVPVLFQPLHKEGITYCDGGIFSNFPINECIANNANPIEILGVNNRTIDNCNNDLSTFSLFEYIVFFIGKLFQLIFNNLNDQIGYYFLVNIESSYLDNIMEVAESKDERKKLVKMGVDVFNEQYT